MKKLALLFILAVSAVLFTQCNSTKKAQESPSKSQGVTYTGNIQAIVAGNCSPCHFPDKGNKKPLNNYEAVKGEINDIIRRIELQPNERGFMPMRHPRLSQDTINLFKQWRDGGLAE